MSIFKRSTSEAPAPAPAQAPQATAAPGLVTPAATPMLSTRPADAAPRIEGATESVVAEKVRTAREAQESAQEKVRLAVRRTRTMPPLPPGAQRQTLPATTSVATCAPRSPYAPTDPVAYAQAGLLGLAWRWQEAGAPMRAIHAYVELLQRYPGTTAASAAVADLVHLSEKLAAEGQFHTALLIYDHLDQLA